MTLNKEYLVEGSISLTIKFRDTFSSTMDDDDIADYIKQNIDDYLDNEIEIDSIDIDSAEVVSYDDATCDERYDEMRLEQLERGEE